MFSFSDNHKSIKEINTMFSSGSLIVDESYQRRSVWGEKDKIRLIETILLKLVIPEVFFWKAETDPETGESVTHIVDGQQRIKAISSFIDNDYKLKSQYLLDEGIKEKYGNKFFKDLDPEVKTAFWNYRLMIIEISQESTKEEIVQVFRRLNLTDFNLNDQEKRNSISGDFAALARDLSENEIWEEKHLFNNTDIKRMKDVEFCGTLILLYRQGIIDQTDQKPLNQAYEDLQTGYTDAEDDKQHICDAIIDERLDEINIEWSDEPTACVVMASGGYPESYKKGIEMFGLDDKGQVEGATVYHAGTKYENGKFYTNGGRVLGVTASGKTLDDALNNAYNAVKKISFEGAHYRTDIGRTK